MIQSNICCFNRRKTSKVKDYSSCSKSKEASDITSALGSDDLDHINTVFDQSYTQKYLKEVRRKRGEFAIDQPKQGM